MLCIAHLRDTLCANHGVAMSLTCLNCRTVVKTAEGSSPGKCSVCGGELVVLGDAWLRWSGPDSEGKVALLDHMSIGRLASRDLVLKHREVSKHHASIIRRTGSWVLRDENSSNGTFVNGKRVFEYRLKDGDKVQIGAFRLEFHSSRAPDSVGAVTIIPSAEGTDSIQASVRCEPGGFKPAKQVSSNDELREDYESLRLAYQFHQYMASERNPNELMKNILRLAFELVPADRGVILVREEEGAPLSPSVTLHRSRPDAPIVIPDSILRHSVEDRTAVLSADAMQDLRFQKSVSVISAQVRSAMCVPLVAQKEVLGAIHLDTQEKTGAFSVKDLQLLSILAGQAAILLERARLNRKLDREAEARNRLARFLAPEVLREVVERGLDLNTDGRTGTVTVLFCDIRGFTPMVESMEPAVLLPLLNAFFERMVDVVFRNGGVLDKFIGDALMAVWGAPLRRADDARRAVTAGLEMIDEVANLNHVNKGQGLPSLQVGVGLNTGEAVIGTVGSPRRMEYTVLGDAVNLASRVCDLAKGQQILVTAGTLESASSETGRPPKAKRLPPAKVRGRKKAVQVFEVLGI